jgi:hypothetical protein
MMDQQYEGLCGIQTGTNMEVDVIAEWLILNSSSRSDTCVRARSESAYCATE